MEKLLMKCLHRINRNIVECKEQIAQVSDFPKVVLRETLWNVKGITNKYSGDAAEY